MILCSLSSLSFLLECEESDGGYKGGECEMEGAKDE
jgi:hypothetical protein